MLNNKINENFDNLDSKITEFKANTNKTISDISSDISENYNAISDIKTQLKTINANLSTNTNNIITDKDNLSTIGAKVNTISNTVSNHDLSII
jgi:DNA repair ATPase RecN